MDYILEFRTVSGIKRVLINLPASEQENDHSPLERENDLSTSERENERCMGETYDRIIGSIRKKPQHLEMRLQGFVLD